ncbi:MAG: phosphorylase [Methylococcaceae bacterium]|nr:phosphorylase [Methylococcaceae bacterium]
MTSVGLVVALPGEKRTLTKARILPGRFSRLNDKTLILLSGIGPDKAAAGAEILIGQGCNALLSWGCAAALEPELKPGDLIIPEKILCANAEAFNTGHEWRGKLLDRLADHQTIHTGPITESRTLVGTAADKLALRNQTGAIALDMESAAIARLAARQNLPFVTIRAIADPASMDLPKPVATAVNQNGDLKFSLLLALIARNPGSIPGLVQLAICFRAAQRRLRLTAFRLEYDFYPNTADAQTSF